MKKWKAPNDVQKKKFDNAMNFNKVAIKNAFSALKIGGEFLDISIQQ